MTVVLVSVFCVFSSVRACVSALQPPRAVAFLLFEGKKRASDQSSAPSGHALSRSPPSLRLFFCLEKAEKKRGKVELRKRKIEDTHDIIREKYFLPWRNGLGNTSRHIKNKFFTYHLPLSSDKSCLGLFSCEILLQRWPIINLLPVISSCGSGYQPSHHFAARV